MAPTEEYEPNPTDWVRRQIEQIDATGTTDGVTVLERPIVLLTTRGAKTGKLRRVPLMRVEHEGEYLAVASKGGDPKHPVWYFNLKTHPDLVLQDGSQTWEATAAEITDLGLRARWWDRAVAAYPPYADYQEKSQGRLIPVFLLTKRG